MSDVTRVEFDATLEEIVDVDMRLVMSTKTCRRGRRQSQWIVGVIIAGVVAVALQDHLPLTAMAALTALSSFLSGSLYGVFYETWVKQSYTLMVHELYADATTVPCAFELRDDACWGKTGHIEVAFPWSQGVSLNDRGDCIEVWCHPTLAVIRNRAFRSDSGFCRNGKKKIFAMTYKAESRRSRRIAAALVGVSLSSLVMYMLYHTLERMYYDYYFFALVKEHYIAPPTRYRVMDATFLVGMLVALYVAYRRLRYSFVVRTQPASDR